MHTYLKATIREADPRLEGDRRGRLCRVKLRGFCHRSGPLCSRLRRVPPRPLCQGSGRDARLPTPLCQTGGRAPRGGTRARRGRHCHWLYRDRGRGLAAEHYRRVISEKTRDALARLRAKGRQVSRFAPYGYRLASGGRLVVNLKEQALLGHIEALRSQALSLRAISRDLASRGTLARNGRPFGPSTLLGIVRKRTVPNTKEAQ